MLRYAKDLYPRTDPINGARIVRFSKLQAGSLYTAHRNGTGAGRLLIRGDDVEAELIDPRGLQYVRFVEIDDSSVDGGTLSGFAERVVGGDWLEAGNFELLTRDESRLLEFSGPGTLAYLARQHLWSRSYAYADDSIVDGNGTWHFYAQPSIAGGDFLGGVAVRILTEALSFAATPTLDDDKPDTAIPGVTFGGGLGVYNDSAGAAWTIPSGEFKAQTGDNILTLMRRLMEAGLYIEMHPGTFALHVWERDAPNSRGFDKSGPAWAAADPVTDERTVRFQAPTDGTVGTGNIKSETKRALSSYIVASTVLAGDGELYVARSNPAIEVPWHRFVRNDAQNAETLTYVADAQLEARGDAGDVVKFAFKIGTDPVNGYYRPFTDYDPSGDEPDATIMVNDRVSVNTGAGQLDYNEAVFPVSSLTVELTSDHVTWGGRGELGSTYTSMGDRAFTTPAAPTLSPGPNPRLCVPGVDCADLTAAMLTAGTAVNGNAESTGDGQWSGGSGGTSGYHSSPTPHGGTYSYGQASGATSADYSYTFDPSQVFLAGVRYVIDFWHSSAGLTLTRDSYFGADGVDEATGFDVIGVETVDTREWTRLRICWTPSADRTGVRVRQVATYDASGEILLDDLALYTTANDELAGASNRASRCGHGHRAHEIVYNPSASGLDTTNMQDAIDEVAAHGVDTSDAHDASAISILDTADNYAGTDLEAVLAEIASRLADRWFNLADYGVVGDDSTDDTTAVQAWADAAMASAHTSVVAYVPQPASKYKITAAINWTTAGAKKVRVLGFQGGEWIGGPTFRQATTDTSGFVFDQVTDNSTVEGITLEGPGGNSLGAGIECVRSISTKRVHITGFRNGYHATSNLSFYSKHWQSGFIGNDSVGALYQPGNNNADFFGCRFESNGAHGIHWKGGEKIAVIGGSIELSGAYGILIDSDASEVTDSVLLDGVYFENSGHMSVGIGISTATNVRAVAVRSCHFTSSDTWHIDAQYVDGLHITDNGFLGGKSKVRATSPAANVVLGRNYGSGSYGTMPTSTISYDPADSRVPVAVASANAAGSGPALAFYNHEHEGEPAGTVDAHAADPDAHHPAASAGIGPILITSEPAGSPLVFSDLLQNSEGTDLLYASEP